MADKREQAAELLRRFKGDDYVFGLGCFGRLGELAASCGRRASVVASGAGREWGLSVHEAARASLTAAGVGLAGEMIRGAAPNAPIEDVLRIADSLRGQKPDVVVAIGGGSVIDATKTAVAYLALGERCADLDAYFGVGEITKMLTASSRKLLPVVAVQLAASSAAHLTKYAAITDVRKAQKMIIVDDAIVPPKALFDYRTTTTMSAAFTIDGAMDGISHCLEVFLGVSGEALAAARPVCLLGIDLCVNNVRAAVRDGRDHRAREALGLGTDLGGCAIMICGTSGGHLTSFSLVDILPHGRACALMNPYYVVFFAPAVEDRLREVGAVYQRAGYIKGALDRLSGRDLGLAVAEGMIALSRRIGFPTTLAEVEGFTDAHVARALTAAKNPKLESKLKNMPVPLSAGTVDEYMGPILEAARTGDFRRIRNMP